jgi:hypothetical protein
MHVRERIHQAGDALATNQDISSKLAEIIATGNSHLTPPKSIMFNTLPQLISRQAPSNSVEGRGQG